jgi:hypothetical protein
MDLFWLTLAIAFFMLAELLVRGMEKLNEELKS